MAGVFFAYAYYGIFATIKGHSPLLAEWRMFTGVVHGVVVMLFVAIAVLEHHPLKRYQTRGPMTGRHPDRRARHLRRGHRIGLQRARADLKK